MSRAARWRFHMPFRQLDVRLFPAIFTLAIPTMIEQLLHTAVQYIDTAMIGALGTSATAAVGATTTVNWLIGSTVSALGVGFLAYISQAIGAGEPEKAHRAAAQAVRVVLVVGLLCTVLTVSLSSYVPIWMQVDSSIQSLATVYFRILYLPMLFRTASMIFGMVLRAAGDTKTPMYVGIAVNVINMVLNFCLIYPTRTIALFSRSFTLYGAGLGVKGAAIASAVAYTFGGTAAAIALWRHPHVSPRGQSLRPDGSVLRPCLRVAFPNMLQRFATSLGYVVFAAMINALGEIPAAAHTIANTVESAFYIPGYGMQTATATLAGNAWGAQDREKLRRLMATILPIEVLLMLASGGMLFACAPPLMRMFSADAQVITLGTIVLRMVAFSEPFFGVSIVFEGMLQGLGKTAAPFIYNVLGMWCVRIVGTFLFTRCFAGGLIAAWACMIAHNLTLCICFAVHHWRWQRVT